MSNLRSRFRGAPVLLVGTCAIALSISVVACGGDTKTETKTVTTTTSPPATSTSSSGSESADSEAAALKYFGQVRKILATYNSEVAPIVKNPTINSVNKGQEQIEDVSDQLQALTVPENAAKTASLASGYVADMADDLDSMVTAAGENDADEVKDEADAVADSAEQLNNAIDLML